MEKKYTNLKKRVIPIILVKDYQVVKSRQFKDYRTFGNLEQTINVFNNRNVDEIIILDIDASKKNKKVDLEILSILSKNNIMPLSFGGGINSIKDIELCLKYGCDKVVINTSCLKNINFIKEASKVFGKQCIVCSVDYKFDNDNLKIYSHIGLNTEKLEIKNYINDLINNGAGEIILTSVKNEGLMRGFDKNLHKILSGELEIPILVNGGCGEPKDILEILNKNQFDAVCASSIFFYTQFGYSDIKNFLLNNNINVRA
jgi:imidazole glycerol-phosphate synthase subunit HisF